MIIPVLLAGGVGSRLWPLSRELYPKQCINLFDGEKSLIQQTAERTLAIGLQSSVNQFRQRLVFTGVGAVIVIMADQEAGRIGLMVGIHLLDPAFCAGAFLLGAQHHRRAVGVIGTNVHAVVTHALLKPYPYIRLDLLHHMPQMYLTVGIGEGAGNENFAWGTHTMVFSYNKV